MVFRLILIIAVTLFFSSKSPSITLANMEMGEVEFQETSEGEFFPKLESKNNLAYLPILYLLLSSLTFNRFRRSVLSFIYLIFFSIHMFRGPPSHPSFA